MAKKEAIKADNNKKPHGNDPKKIVIKKQIKEPAKEPVEEVKAEEVKPKDTPKERIEKRIGITNSGSFGRLSPDGMVELCKQLNECYIKPDVPEAPYAAASTKVMHSYLLHISMLQIKEDAPALSMKIDSADMDIFNTAAKMLGTNILSIKALPAENGEKEQMELEFDENTVPKEITEKLQKEEEIKNDVELSMEFNSNYTQEELRRRLLHILLKRPNGADIDGAVNWLYRNSVSPLISARNNYVAEKGLCEDAEKREKDSVFIEMSKNIELAEATKKVDLFNEMLDILGDEAPLSLKGIMNGVYYKYCNCDTILPMHIYMKNHLKKWSDEEIRDLNKFIVIHEMNSDHEEKVPVCDLLSGINEEFLEKRVNEMYDAWIAEKKDDKDLNLIINNFNKLVCVKRKPQRERIGSLLQSLSNLYLDQSKQAARLAKYKDLSEYSLPETSEKKN